jgi:hypothetical protein
MLIKDKRIRADIRKFFPAVDIDADMKYSDFNILIKGIAEKKNQGEIKKRLALIAKKGIDSGASVRDDEGNIFIVSRVRPDGYLSLKGKKGGHSAVYLNLI